MSKPSDIVYLSPERVLKEQGPGRNGSGQNGSGQNGSLITHSTSRLSANQPTRQVSREAAPGKQDNGKQNRPGTETELEEQLRLLAELIANVVEAYTVAIFLADRDRSMLSLGAVHTLSRDFIHQTEIPFGNGLVGWTAENAVRISVCPFEHDATTLLYYSRNQDLKSFMAVPILDEQGEILGVIACDSKKSYAFAKVTEKILLDCAKQAALSLGIAAKLGRARNTNSTPAPDVLTSVLDQLREKDDEEALLSYAARLPEALIQRDALVVITTADTAGICPGNGGNFYSHSKEEQVGHRLLELVCKHKKVICGERSVHAPPLDDTRQRSFLSVPFHVLGREAGSLNLLSPPHAAFSAADITALERIAQVLGRELERIRMRERILAQREESPALSWKQFEQRAAEWLAAQKASRSSLTLIRLSFTTGGELEAQVGIGGAMQLMNRALRLVTQVAQPPAIVCTMYGSQALILLESAEADRTIIRLRRLLERIESDPAEIPRSGSARVGGLLAAGLQVSHASAPRDGHTIEQLAAKTRAVLETAPVQAQGKVANVGNW